MKLPLLLGCVLLCGCTHPTSSKLQSPHVAPTVTPTVTPTTGFELPSLGVQLRAPCTMEIVEHEQPMQDGPMHMRGSACTDGTQYYNVARFFREGRDRAKDGTMLDNTRKALKSISREARSNVGEWASVDLEGVANDGKTVWIRNIVMGDGFWILQVERPTGSLDHDRARAFLDSIVLTQTWSVHAFPEANLSVSLPDGAVRFGKKALHGEEFTVAEGSWLGGSETRMFAVWGRPLLGNTTPDERMDTVQSTLNEQGNRLIWQAPIEVDGARGRDFLMQSKASWMRLRMVITDTDLYLLQASAASKDALLDPSVPRFLSSLRWFVH